MVVKELVQGRNREVVVDGMVCRRLSATIKSQAQV